MNNYYWIKESVYSDWRVAQQFKDSQGNLRFALIGTNRLPYQEEVYAFKKIKEPKDFA